MRYLFTLIAPLALTALLWSVAGAADPEPAAKQAAVAVIHAGTQTHCPVGGGEIDKAVYEDHQGQRVYFCCPGCEETFLKDAEKHFQAIGAKGQTVASIQTACPITGKPISAEVHVEHAGRRVFFCCPGCPPKFTGSPAQYLPELH